MKYLSYDPFEKHLSEALPDHPSEGYFLFLSDPFERRILAEQLAGRLGLKMAHYAKENFLDAFDSPSLFDERRAVICDEPDLKSLPLTEGVTFIITGKSPPPFYADWEKRGVTLDLRSEKPWERSGRIKRWLLEEARREGKGFAPGALEYLLESGGKEFPFLLQELHKLITYAGEEKNVTLQMVKTLGASSTSESGWQQSEAIVWGGKMSEGEIDPFGIAPQIRYQLQIGLQIAQGKPPQRLSPQKKEKIERSGLTAEDYLEGLKDLFAFELAMRSNSGKQRLHFDHFRAKLSRRWR